MKTIYLLENGTWEKFDYENLSDLSEEFAKRRISIGNRTTIGNRTAIGNDTTIGYRTTIGDGTTIGNRTTIGDDTKIGDNTTIGYGTTIGDRTTIGDGTTIGDDTTILKSIFIVGSRHSVCWWQNGVINIGCKQFTIGEWMENFENIGKSEGYSDNEIEEYVEYIEICARLQGKFGFNKNEKS
jgi:carbonic anhydrase/acetyltransferase-like protein (isoleucine patch superfamily)